jgi:hypothetical protein
VARVTRNQKNPWGSQAGLGGEEPQRADLWVVDLTSAINNISTALNISLDTIPAYFAQSVSFPELRVKPDQFRRDSRPYNMPVWDDPPDGVKINFILDAAEEGKSSRIYRVLDAWRSLVRAGRGAMSSETLPDLNANYRIDFQFNINIALLKGGSAHATQTAQNPTDALVSQQRIAQKRSRAQKIFTLLFNGSSTTQKQAATSVADARSQQAAASLQQASSSASTALLVSSSTQQTAIDNDLQVSGRYTLVKAWLGGFRLTDLSYANSTIASIEATFYPEDVYDLSNGRQQ